MYAPPPWPNLPSSPGYLTSSGGLSRPRNGICTSLASCLPIRCSRVRPFDREGNLYCVDIPWGRVFKIDPKGGFTLLAEYDGEPNGLKIHRDGRIFIADYKNGIVVLDPVTGKVEPFLARVRLERLKAVNDLVFASNGDMYFTDQGLTGLHDPTGRVFRVRADGRVDCLLDNIPSPNGIVLDPSETVLYVAVTRANAIWRVPLMRDGTVAKVGNFIQLSGGGGPDGLAMDEAGNLCVAHIGIGAVWLFNPGRRAPAEAAIASRPTYDQYGLWRRGPANALHHRIRDRHDLASGDGRSGPPDVLA